MPATKGYETAADRVRLLYRIPKSPNGNRVLELYHTGKPLLSDCLWLGTSKTFCQLGLGGKATTRGNTGGEEQASVHGDIGVALPFVSQVFDIVIAHHILDDLATLSMNDGKKFRACLFFKNILTVLAAGGLVVGCVDNRWSVKSLKHRFSLLNDCHRPNPPPRHFTLRGLRKALSEAGFVDIRLFSLLPNCSSPFKLIDTEPRISRAAFRHELETVRNLTSASGYVIRRIAVELGLSRHLEESIFFWAYKPC